MSVGWSRGLGTPLTRGEVGLSEVAAALNTGRVAHPFYDPEVRYTGSVSDDGALYAGDELGPDGRPGLRSRD